MSDRVLAPPLRVSDPLECWCSVPVGVPLALLPPRTTSGAEMGRWPDWICALDNFLPYALPPEDIHGDIPPGCREAREPIKDHSFPTRRFRLHSPLRLVLEESG